MASKEFFVLNSFSTDTFGGNPAGVFLESDDLSDRQMQQIAKQLNLVETAFVFRSPEPGIACALRYFTPTRELPITGHPTIAAWCALIHAGVIAREGGTYLQRTQAGDIRIKIQEGQVYASQKRATMRILDESLCARIAAAVNLRETDIDPARPFARVDAGLGHLIFAVRSLEALFAMRFDPAVLSELCRDVGTRECQVFTAETRNSDYTAHTRNLCPRLGLEDPACGNGNAALGAYYWECVEPYSRRDTLLFEQGHIVGMPSLIRVVRDSDGEVMIGGSARIMIKGVFHL